MSFTVEKNVVNVFARSLFLFYLIFAYSSTYFFINHIICKNRFQLVGGTVRWYYCYRLCGNYYVNKFFNDYDYKIVPFQEMVKDLNKLKDKIDSFDEQGKNGQTLMHYAWYVVLFYSV